MKALKLSDIKISGLNLIEASAGTGKTWTIAALYLRLLLERNIKPEEILVVTYTRAATSELKERIRQRIVTTLEMFNTGRQPVDELEEVLTGRCPDREKTRQLLTRALFSFDSSAVFTIHGFCQRALADSAFESGSLFDTDMISDQSALVQEAADDFWRKYVLVESSEFVAQLVTSGYSPEKLLKNLNGLFQNYDLTIIPPPLDSDFSAIAEKRLALFRQAADLWRSGRGEITALLCKPGLSQNSYKPQQIDKAASVITNWFGGTPSPLSDKLLFFCKDSLTKRTTKGSATPDHLFFDLCQKLHETCLDAEAVFRQKLINLQHQLHAWLKTELPRRKQMANLRCYDDLLLDLRQALHGEKGEQMAFRLRDRYKAALIDEFQDTDPLQWQIFRCLADAENYPLFLIGDPKQAIYSFRGADIHAYLSAANTVDGENRWTLDTNRRSTVTLVAAVNKLFNIASDPFLSKGIEFQPVRSGRLTDDKLLENLEPDDKPLRFLIYPDMDEKKTGKVKVRQHVAAAVTAEVSRLLNGSFRIIDKSSGRNVGPGDIAILVRTHSQAEIIKQSLTESGIRTVQYGSTTIFETQEAIDLLRVFRAMAAPGNSALMREAMLGGLLGINANMLNEIIRDDQLWDSWLERFRSLNETFHGGGVIAMVSCLLDECDARKSMLSLPDGERRLTNLLHCTELVHHAMLESGAGIEGCVKWLENRITGHQEDETALLRLESDDDAVRISTIHASKGLQYPIVFIPFAWDASAKPADRVIFHGNDSGLVLDLGSEQLEDNRQKSVEEHNAEAVRLLYVALTRAEFRCYVAWGAIAQADASPLCRLLHGCGEKPFKEYSAADVLADIRKIACNADGITASLIDPDIQPSPVDSTKNASDTKPTYRKFDGAIANDWLISSFSSIAGGQERHLQPRDIDAVTATEYGSQTVHAATAAPLTIFGFPKGPAAGTCLHELFERLDFSNAGANSIESLAISCLQKNGYGACWAPAVAQMTSDLLETAVLADQPNFTLGKLKPGSWTTEMEFYLPLKTLNAPCLKELFSGQLDASRHGNFSEFISNLRFQQTRGLLLGFIDMVFEHNGRYYIIDWKSNHLGYDLEAYGQEHLRDAMAKHAYILQYHLYTLALDRFLAWKIPAYDYEKHFGGAVYVFLRGISPKRESNGIFFDRPDSEFIKRANDYILAGNHTT